MGNLEGGLDLMESFGASIVVISQGFGILVTSWRRLWSRFEADLGTCNAFKWWAGKLLDEHADAFFVSIDSLTRCIA